MTSLPTADDLATVAGARVFFGHQSVGQDVLGGIHRLYAQRGEPAPPVEDALIGANQDRNFRAYDIANGKELWRFKLPAPAGATPMTYLSKKSGKQFVVISGSGHGRASRSTLPEVRVGSSSTTASIGIIGAGRCPASCSRAARRSKQGRAIR